MPFILCVGDEIQYPCIYFVPSNTEEHTSSPTNCEYHSEPDSKPCFFIKNRILVPQTDLFSYLFSITTLRCPKKDSVLTWDTNILPVPLNFYKAVMLCAFLLFNFSSALWRDMLESKRDSQSVSFTSWVSANVLTCVLVLVDGSCLVSCGSSRNF